LGSCQRARRLWFKTVEGKRGSLMQYTSW
jgi:hypothetical protein